MCLPRARPRLVGILRRKDLQVLNGGPKSTRQSAYTSLYEYYVVL